MAAGKDKQDSADPIERAMQRRADAEKAARDAAPKAPRESVIGSAMAKPPAATPPKREPDPDSARTFYDPLPPESYDRTLYEPEDVSFFAPSAEERADQARRAAQRVRRRAKGEEIEPHPAAKPVPGAARAKPKSAPAEGPRVERARVEPTAPRPIAEVTAPKTPAEPKAPAAPAPPVKSKTVAAPAEPKAPVQTRKPAERKSVDDLISRASERSASRAAPEQPKTPASRAEPKPAQPKAPEPKPQGLADGVPDFAKLAASAPLIERAGQPSKPKIKPAEATAPPAKPAALRTPSARSLKAAQPSPPPPTTRETRATTPAPAATPTARPTQRVVPPVPSSAPPVTAPASAAAAMPASESFEAAYVDAPEVEDSVYAAPKMPRSAKTKAFAPFEWMIASRYLRARKKEGFVSVIAGFSLVGIALGVATLIVVMAVMTGFRETLITQIIGGSPHINVVSQSEKFTGFDALADNLRTVDGVQYVAPVVQAQVLGTGKRGHSGVMVRGMRKADLTYLINAANPEFTRGSLTDFTPETNVAAVGANLAAKLGLRVGDFIALTSPDGDITPMSVDPMPRKKAYKIIYTFKLGVQEVDYGVVFLPFKEAQIYLNKKGVADTLDIFVDDPNNVDKYTDPLFQSARTSISLYNWKNSNGRLIGAINLERQVMFVILTMIILVAALNIISGLVMLVKDKSRDVAIMRTMGMARGSILRIFFICGSSIGVIGSLLGVALGVAFVWNIKSVQTFVEWATGTTVWDPAVRAGMTEIPTKMQFTDVSLTLFIALGLSFVATLYPAWKAAKLDPVEALRYE